MSDHEVRGRLRVGVDVGGTFTDLCVWEEESGRLFVKKVPTNPRDQAESVLVGILEAVADAGHHPDAVVFIGHGTTVALNALLERKGARIAFVTTEGFRDVLELARQKRADLYDFFADRPAPLAPRHLRYEVKERTFADGTIPEPVTRRSLAPVVRALRQAGVDALAIGFINSYRNAENERQAKDILSAAFPGLPITASYEIAQEFREFERFSTTAMNAYLVPRIARYLGGLSARLASARVHAEPLIFQSNGAVIPLSVAAVNPVRTLMSGPAGGVLGAAFVARQAGVPDIITFDMGGTSTDVSLIEQGTPAVTSARDVDGYPILGASFDVRSIGAGGGSIAWVDAGGFIKVGPQSAGADPGPSCYGRGGGDVTVTDADLALGYLSADTALGGNLRLHAGASMEALGRLAERARLDPWSAAAGVVRIVTANIARLTRLVAFERGRDPRDFTLVAYGGAGPLHAGLVARELGIPKIFVPAYPGLLCAAGMLVADLRADFSQTLVIDLDGSAATDARMPEIAGILTELEARGRQLVREGALGPTTSGEPFVRVSGDLRYKGQNYELTVPLRRDSLSDARSHPGKVLAQAVEDFHRMHDRIYGHSSPQSVVQLVTIRLGVGIEQTLPSFSVRHGGTLPPAPGSASAPASPGRRAIRLVDSPATPIDCAVYPREALRAGEAVRGPAVIEQMDSTILVLPDQIGVTDAAGNLLISEGGA